MKSPVCEIFNRVGEYENRFDDIMILKAKILCVLIIYFALADKFRCIFSN